MTNMENIKKPERGPVPFHSSHDKNATTASNWVRTLISVKK